MHRAQHGSKMSDLPTTGKETPRKPDTLSEAFLTFQRAAGSLETFYSTLQAEVRRLGRQLEQTHRELASSLEENRRMRAYLGRILDALPCGVLVIDSAGSPRLINPEARRLLGILSETDLDESGAPMEKLERLPRPESGREETGQADWSFEGPDGVRELSVLHTALSGADGAEEERVYIVRDLTDEKRSQQEREAARRVQALADMVTLLAHEVRNPLGSLELFAGLLADNSQRGSEPREWADQLRAGLRTLSATVNNVLQLHSVPAPEQTRVHAGRLLGETVEFLGPLARQWETRIDYSEHCESSWIWSEPHCLRQVFLNLAINAFKAMPLGGNLRIRVTVTTYNDTDSIQIEFEDEGEGISTENLDKIFEAGFTTTPNSSGIGLAVCKQIVENNGGTIRVRSRVGEGTVLILNFPATGEAE